MNHRFVLPFFAAILALAQTVPPLDHVGTIQQTSREVLLELTVHDKTGRLYTRLRPNAFSVYDNGVLQPVTSFRLVTGAEVRAQDTRTATPPSPALTKSGSPQLDTLRPINLVAIVFGNLSGNTRKSAMDSADQFLDDELRPNTFVGIYGLSASGFTQLVPFSHDRTSLRDAVRRIASGQSAADTLTSGGNLGPTSIAGLAGHASSAMDAASILTRANQPFSGDLNMAGLDLTHFLSSMVSQLGTLPYRKTVLWIGQGITRPYKQISVWDTFLQKARDANVVFYAVDAYGLMECQDKSGVCDGPAVTPLTPAVQALNAAAAQSNMQQQKDPFQLGSVTGLIETKEDDQIYYTALAANPQQGLVDLTTSTGGFLIANANNVASALKKVMDEVDTHYEVTYHPTLDHLDGRFHKVEIRLANKDLHPITRDGYFAVPDPETLTRADLDALRALNQAPAPQAFPFGAQIFALGMRKYSVVWDVPVATLTSKNEPNTQRHQFHAVLYAQVKNAEGDIIERFSRDVPSEVADQYLDQVKADSITFEHSFAFPSDARFIETAVLDEEGNRSSVKVLPIQMPEPAKLTVSDIALAKKVENVTALSADPNDPFQFYGKRVVPSLQHDFNQGQNLLAFMFAYARPNDSHPLELKINYLRDGKPVKGQRKGQLPQPDASGRVPILFNVSAEPGTYELIATVSQGNASSTRTIAFTVKPKGD